MQRFPSSPLSMFRSLWLNRGIVWQLTRRDVIGRYRGSVFGLAWSFFNPILMLTVYTFVFSVVFRARWGVSPSETRVDFAIILFAGLIIHSLLAECVNRAPTLVPSNVSYVKRVVFPLEILPWVAMGSALFHALVSLVVLLAFYAIVNGALQWTTLFLPLVVLPLVFGTMGFAWFLASLGVYLRDVGQVTGIITTVLMFLSPIFYPLSSIPPSYRTWIYINPLTFVIEQARAVLIWGRLPDWFGWGIYFGVSLAIAWAGFWWFQKTRRGFADVL